MYALGSLAPTPGLSTQNPKPLERLEPNPIDPNLNTQTPNTETNIHLQQPSEEPFKQPQTLNPIEPVCEPL